MIISCFGSCLVGRRVRTTWISLLLATSIGCVRVTPAKEPTTTELLDDLELAALQGDSATIEAAISRLANSPDAEFARRAAIHDWSVKRRSEAFDRVVYGEMLLDRPYEMQKWYCATSIRLRYEPEHLTKFRLQTARHPETLVVEGESGFQRMIHGCTCNSLSKDDRAYRLICAAAILDRPHYVRDIGWEAIDTRWPEVVRELVRDGPYFRWDRERLVFTVDSKAQANGTPVPPEDQFMWIDNKTPLRD
jgi:hypothetical protein